MATSGRTQLVAIIVADPNNNPKVVELLLRLWNAEDRIAGIAVVDLPETLCNDALLTVASAAGMIEFGRRNHCHVGAGEHKKLVLENGWNFASLNSPGKKRVRDLLREALSEQAPPEIRYHVRLTAAGEAEAGRLLLERDHGTVAGSAEHRRGDRPGKASSSTSHILQALPPAFETFAATLDATTILQLDGGRRVDGIPHAVALSESADTLAAAIAEARTQLLNKHGQTLPGAPSSDNLTESDHPSGPWSPVPSTSISVQAMPIGGDGADARLLAALDSASRVVAFSVEAWNTAQARNPGGNHQRWQAHDVISSSQLETLESARKLLDLYRQGTAAQKVKLPDATVATGRQVDVVHDTQKTTTSKRKPAVSKRKKKAKPPNGPRPPNHLLWNGQSHTLPPRCWQLLKCCWRKPPLAVDDVIEKVWGDEGIRESTFKSTVSKLNGCLRELGLPLQMTTKSAFVKITLHEG